MTASRASDVPCVVCGQPAPVRELFSTFRAVVQCNGCGLVSSPAPADAEEYDERYYRGLVYADYLAEREAIRRNARRALAEIEAKVTGRALLDVGCAAGFFLEEARARGWSVRGLEVSRYASEQARRLGLPVETASIESLPAEPQFDAVTLWDVVEHLERPHAALRRARALLRNGGLLVVSTGDYRSLLRRVTGRRWRLFADPTHRFFFTEATLRRLLVRCGFDVAGIHRRGKWVSLRMGLQQSPLPLAGVLGNAMARWGLNPSLYVNLRDVMTVTAGPA